MKINKTDVIFVSSFDDKVEKKIKTIMGNSVIKRALLIDPFDLYDLREVVDFLGKFTVTTSVVTVNRPSKKTKKEVKRITGEDLRIGKSSYTEKVESGEFSNNSLIIANGSAGSLLAAMKASGIEYKEIARDAALLKNSFYYDDIRRKRGSLFSVEGKVLLEALCSNVSDDDVFSLFLEGVVEGDFSSLEKKQKRVEIFMNSLQDDDFYIKKVTSKYDVAYDRNSQKRRSKIWFDSRTIWNGKLDYLDEEYAVVSWETKSYTHFHGIFSVLVLVDKMVVKSQYNVIHDHRGKKILYGISPGGMGVHLYNWPSELEKFIQD